MQVEGETQVIKYVKYMVSEDDKPREKKKQERWRAGEEATILNRIVLEETCIRQNKKKDPAVIEENIIPGRGDHECKTSKTVSFLACWSESNDASVAEEKAVRGKVPGEVTGRTSNKGIRAPVRALAFVLSDIESL